MPSISRSLLLVYGANGVNGVLSAFTIPIAVGLLGFSGYGLFSIYSFLAAWILMGDLGIGKNLLRQLSTRREPSVELLRVAFTLYLVLAAAWLAVSPLIAELISHTIFAVPPEHVSTLKWLTFLAFLEFAAAIPVSLLQTNAVAAQRFDAYARFSLVTGIARNVVMFCAAYAFQTPVAIAAALVGKRLVDNLIAAYILGRLPASAWKPRLDVTAFRSMLGQSSILSVATLLNSTIAGLASALVNANFGLSGLGLYRSASDIAAKIAFVSNGLGLVAFPHASSRLGTRGGAIMSIGRASDLTGVSTIVYACLAAITVTLAPVIFPLIGLHNPTIIGLFSLLIIGLSINAHSVLSNELVQASGRYRLSISFNLTMISALALSFYIFRTFLGIYAIGWAWVVAALLAAGVIDGCLLSLCNATGTHHVKSVLLKLLSTAACIGVAAPQLGLAGRLVTLFSAALLVGMLLFNIWRALPHILRFAKTGFQGSEPVGTYA